MENNFTSAFQLLEKKISEYFHFLVENGFIVDIKIVKEDQNQNKFSARFTNIARGTEVLVSVLPVDNNSLKYLIGCYVYKLNSKTWGDFFSVERYCESNNKEAVFNFFLNNEIELDLSLSTISRVMKNELMNIVLNIEWNENYHSTLDY